MMVPLENDLVVEHVWRCGDRGCVDSGKWSISYRVVNQILMS